MPHSGGMLHAHYVAVGCLPLFRSVPVFPWKRQSRCVHPVRPWLCHCPERASLLVSGPLAEATALSITGPWVGGSAALGCRAGQWRTSCRHALFVDGTRDCNTCSPACTTCRTQVCPRLCLGCHCAHVHALRHWELLPRRAQHARQCHPHQLHKCGAQTQCTHSHQQLRTRCSSMQPQGRSRDTCDARATAIRKHMSLSTHAPSLGLMLQGSSPSWGSLLAALDAAIPSHLHQAT